MRNSTRTISAVESTAINQLNQLAPLSNLPKPNPLPVFVKAKAREPLLCDTRTRFASILRSVRRSNIQRLKNRAFLANRLAKIAVGTSRAKCYQLKDEAINALVRHGAAFLHSVECLPYGPTLGLAFVDGGRLHIPSSRLDLLAQRVVQHQLAATFRDPGSVDVAPVSGVEDCYLPLQEGKP